MTKTTEGSIPRVCLVTTTPLILRFFLLPHIEAMSNSFDITVCYNPENDAYAVGSSLPAKQHFIAIQRQIAPISDIRTLLQLARYFRHQQFDLVITVGPKAGLLGMFGAFLTAVPVRVHIFQGEVWANKTGLKRWLFKLIDKLVAKCATSQLVVGPTELDFLRKQKVLSQNQGCVLGAGTICGVDLLRFKEDPLQRTLFRSELGIPAAGTVALFLGRLNRDKGVLDLVEAFRTASRQVPQLYLLVVGPDEESIIGQAISRLPGSLHRRVIFQTYTERAEQFIRVADFLCLPSYREGFPISILEAAACAVPSIGSDIYGVRNAIIDGETGLLTKVGHVDALTEAILKLARDPELRHQLGAAAKARAIREFEQSQVVGRYVDFFEKVILNSKEC